MNIRATNHSNIRTLSLIVICATLTLSRSIMAAGGNQGNRGIVPPQSHAFGKSYAEWSTEWWKWAVSIPKATNPLFDTTGEFGRIGQSGKVWFLAGAFGGTVERTVTVPVGKPLFFPLLNSLWWAPDDLAFAAYVAESLGFNPDDFTDEELIGLVANFQNGPNPQLSLTIDGVPAQNLTAYRTTSPGFRISDTDLLDDLGAAISQPNMAVAAGYWILLHPLKPGSHTIRFTSAYQDNPIFGSFALDVTYHITVESKKK